LAHAPSSSDQRPDQQNLKERSHRSADIQIASPGQARTAIFRWIAWYNQRRLHSHNNYLPPVEWEHRRAITESIACRITAVSCPRGKSSTSTASCAAWVSPALRVTVTAQRILTRTIRGYATEVTITADDHNDLDQESAAHWQHIGAVATSRIAAPDPGEQAENVRVSLSVELRCRL
jgi:hypothetical protein